MISKLKLSWFLSLLMLAIIVLCLNGKIAFGNGLGDIVFVLGIIACLLISVGINLYFIINKTKVKNSKLLNFSLYFFSLILIYYFYAFTIGRGMEYQWDGNIFKQ